MRPVTELTPIIRGRRVVVLGKGPSLTEAAFREHCGDACVIGINQTVRSFACDIAFFIDIEPFLESASELLQSNAVVILPWRPNQRTVVRSRSKPMDEDLAQLSVSNDALRELTKQGRLYYFHTFFTDRRNADNVFEPNLVSLSSLLQILARLDVREVRTLGVDGGSGHSQAIKGSLYTQLRGGYDKQFPILRRIAMTKRITMSRANGSEIRVFVGAEPEQTLCAKVLEYTIRKYTSERVTVQPLHAALGASDAASQGRTPFSCQRFFIPELCNHQGLAVYLDSDMQVFADIKQLVDHYQEGMAVMSAEAPPGSNRRPQYSVMVINCELARWRGAELAARTQDNYEATMFEFGFEPKKSMSIPYHWNSLERYEPGVTRLLHYTDMEFQPWLSNRNVLARVWIAELNEAVRDGFISFDEVRAAVAAGHVRPGLLYQVEKGEPEPLAIPRRERIKDDLFVPPHTVARFSRHNNLLVRTGLAFARKALKTVRGAR
jgi:hypothetical protein